MYLTEKQKMFTVAWVSFLLKHLLNYSFSIKRKRHSNATKKTSPNVTKKTPKHQVLSEKK